MVAVGGSLGERAAMPAAAKPVYIEMTLEEYLMHYCEEHVRPRLSTDPGAPLTRACVGPQVAKIEQEAEANASKLRCASSRYICALD